MLNLTELLGWGIIDIEALENYIKIAEKFDIEIEDIKGSIQDFDGDITNINYWFYVVMNLIFYKVMDEVEERVTDNELLNKINNIRDNFDPFINYLDSWFNNFLDDIDFNQDKEKILEDVIKALREGY